MRDPDIGFRVMLYLQSAALNTVVFPFSSSLSVLLSHPHPCIPWRLLTLSSQLLYFSMICLQTFVFQLIRTPLTSMFLSLQLLLRRGDSRSSVFSPDLFLQAPESLF